MQVSKKYPCSLILYNFFHDLIHVSALNLTLIGPVVSEEMFKECGRRPTTTDDDDGRRRPTYHISSPNEPLAHLISSHLSPLTLEVVGAPQMTLQQYLSILPCLPLPSGNLQTPFPSIPWCYLPISSSVFLSFLLLSLSLAELSSPSQRILRCGHTIWVSVSLPWLGDHHALLRLRWIKNSVSY